MTSIQEYRRRRGICFIGALNHDYVCACKMPESIRRSVVFDDPKRQIDFSETAISDEKNASILAELPKHLCRSELGGSGFNAARSASLLSSYLRLGFVGVVGSIDENFPHLEFLRRKNVETEFLRTESLPCACSISFTFDGDRTLLTAVGANILAGEYFSASRSRLASYMGTFSTIHVTSFLDNYSTEQLAELLEYALRHEANLRISVDPGAIWVDNLSNAARRVISTASVLHLNEKEFARLGGRLRDEEEVIVAQRIARMMADNRRSIVLRKHKSVTIYDVSSPDCHSVTVDNQIILSNSEVIDATGAGDTLTGLLLAILESDLMAMSLAASLSMNATVEKLRHSGAITEQDLSLGLNRRIGPLKLSSGMPSFDRGDKSDE